VKYLHAAAGFPTKETWLNAINTGNFTTWPTINAIIIRRHFPESDKMAKGHMKKQGRSAQKHAVFVKPISCTD
jgi:hypothetical protein